MITFIIVQNVFTYWNTVDEPNTYEKYIYLLGMKCFQFDEVFILLICIINDILM